MAAATLADALSVNGARRLLAIHRRLKARIHQCASDVSAKFDQSPMLLVGSMHATAIHDREGFAPEARDDLSINLARRRHRQ
jgi:hypothetical protein